jgi:hypothetical protein
MSDYVSGLVQQYSSANFVSLCFIYRKKQFGADFKKVISSFHFLKKNCLSLKFHNLKLRKTGRVCEVTAHCFVFPAYPSKTATIQRRVFGFSSSMTLQSNADLRLLNGLLPFSSVCCSLVKCKLSTLVFLI